MLFPSPSLLLRVQGLVRLRVEGSVGKEMEGPVSGAYASKGQHVCWNVGPSVYFSLSSFTFGTQIFAQNDTLPAPWPS